MWYMNMLYFYTHEMRLLNNMRELKANNLQVAAHRVVGARS